MLSSVRNTLVLTLFVALFSLVGCDQAQDADGVPIFRSYTETGDLDELAHRGVARLLALRFDAERMLPPDHLQWRTCP